MSNPEDIKFYNELVEELIAADIREPVVEAIAPKDLASRLDLCLQEEPLEKVAFQKAVRDLVMHTPRCASKRFFNQLFGGRQSKAVLGELLASFLNNSMATYKVAGAMVGAEKEVVKSLLEILKWDVKVAGGTFPTGGSMSNYMAMLMARDAAEPTARITGTRAPLVAYTSVESHYSHAKNAAFCGVGRDNVRYVTTNPATGAMCPKDLRKLMTEDVKNGLVPFFVAATMGTTVLGAFDPLEPLAAVCKDFKNVWLHADGALGGGAMFSAKHKHLLNGLSEVNSFNLNAHKGLGTPLSCSVLLVQDNRNLHISFSNDADYLYQTDDDDYNLGKASFQCARRNDALKFWSLWKSHGTKGLAGIVENTFHLGDVARNYIKANKANYEFCSFEESITVCFNYKDLCPKDLCTALYEEGELMVGYGEYQGKEFVRLACVNGTNTDEDILDFFKLLEHRAEILIAAKKN